MLATLGVTALLAGCSNAGQHPTSASPSAPGDTSNERTLTHAQSVHLVQWATTYRSCMSSHGWRLGQLTKTPTHLSMALPENVEVSAIPNNPENGKVSAILHDPVACGDAQGGPPAKSSLQFRARTLLLYLPKQCLLDPTVVSR
jgi:hypothetical protein